MMSQFDVGGAVTREPREEQPGDGRGDPDRPDHDEDEEDELEFGR